VTTTATIWRTCPVCGAGFEQPDDPGRKRVYCSRACQQAAYRTRQRQRQAGWQQRTGRQEWRSDWREQRHQRADSGGDGAGQRQQWRQQQREQRQPPPDDANGQRPGATSGVRPKVMCDQCHGLRAPRHTFHHDQAAHQRAQRRHDALLRKAAATTFAHEAAACRAKAEALHDKYGL
jgi:predicted nucleic acid-binding Zn ribbon protein